MRLPFTYFIRFYRQSSLLPVDFRDVIKDYWRIRKMTFPKYRYIYTSYKNLRPNPNLRRNVKLNFVSRLLI